MSLLTHIDDDVSTRDVVTKFASTCIKVVFFVTRLSISLVFCSILPPNLSCITLTRARGRAFHLTDQALWGMLIYIDQPDSTSFLCCLLICPFICFYARENDGRERKEGIGMASDSGHCHCQSRRAQESCPRARCEHRDYHTLDPSGDAAAHG